MNERALLFVFVTMNKCFSLAPKQVALLVVFLYDSALLIESVNKANNTHSHNSFFPLPRCRGATLPQLVGERQPTSVAQRSTSHHHYFHS